MSDIPERQIPEWERSVMRFEEARKQQTQAIRKDGLSMWEIVGLLVLLFGAALAINWANRAWNHSIRPGVVGVDQRATAARIRAMGETLRVADERGDAMLAASLADPTNDLLIKITSLPNIANIPMRNCGVALTHLGKGLMAVAQGGRWVTRDQFKASVDACDD